MRAVPRKLPPGRHGLPRQFVLHNQRGRLVEAAMHVFGTRSFGEARVADVLEHAAISRKTFYEQFADKEACFMAAYEAAAGAPRAIRGVARASTTIGTRPCARGSRRCSTSWPRSRSSRGCCWSR